MGRQTKKKDVAAPVQEAAIEMNTVTKEEKPAVAPAKPKRKIIDPSTEVEVQSNTAGSLIYVSKKTSEKFEWSRLGDSNWMSVEELTTMRNTQRGFFENNWVKIVGDEADDIINYLRLEKYFNEFIDLTELEEFLEMKADDIVKRVSPMKREIKDALASAAIQMINDGELADLNVIRALEKAIGYSLLEN